MSTPNTTDRLGLEPWQVGDLRLTAFLDPHAPVEARGGGKRWEALVGKKPETAISRNFDTEVDESGPFVPGVGLTHRRSRRAIEWMLAPLKSEKPEAFSLMSPQVLVPFKELMCRWLMDCPPLQRLAFGAALYLAVKDRREAYDRLEGFLHLGLKYSDDEGDFLYQYNRRRRSQRLPEVMINRLSKWTWVPLGEVRLGDGKLVFPSESACLLELDVNTAPEFPGTLPHDRYVPLFEEMIGLAAEIAALGDVP
jgi:hypothetical protein